MFLINSSPSSLKNVQNDTSENNIPNRHAFTQQYFHRPALKISRVDKFFKINSIQELSQFSPVSLKLSYEEFVTTLQAVHNPVFRSISSFDKSHMWINTTLYTTRTELTQGCVQLSLFKCSPFIGMPACIYQVHTLAHRWHQMALCHMII